MLAEVGILARPMLAVLVWRIAARGRPLERDPIALCFWAALLATMMNALFASPIYLSGSLGLRRKGTRSSCCWNTPIT